MLNSQIVSLASVALALAAVCVAAWQAYVSMQGARKSNALGVISQVFTQWRSPEFNNALRKLLSANGRDFRRQGFDALPRKYRQNAYEVCYFFDYLGTLVLYDIIDKDIVIGVMANRLMQVWLTMEPLIYNERKYRATKYPPGAPRGFLVYYEHLIRLIEDRGGQSAAAAAQQRAGLLHIELSQARKRRPAWLSGRPGGPEIRRLSWGDFGRGRGVHADAEQGEDRHPEGHRQGARPAHPHLIGSSHLRLPSARHRAQRPGNSYAAQRTRIGRSGGRQARQTTRSRAWLSG